MKSKQSHLLNERNILLGIVFTITFILAMSVSCSSQTPSQSVVSDNIFSNTMVRMTWQEVKAAADKKAIVIFPISVVEEHGPHMDLSPDILITSHICVKIKESLEKDSIPAVVAPPYYWGINISTGAFPGSFNLKESTMKLILTEIIGNMAKWGFERFYFINVHGDPSHRSAISNIASSINSSGVAKVNDVSILPTPPNPPVVPSETPGMYSPDYHAGANETSVVWALEPSVVRTDIASTLKPQSNFPPLGYVGDPANFMKSKGNLIFEGLAELFAKTIEFHLSSTTGINKSESSLPNKFELLQNYPNPFNPETIISYQLSEPGKVGLIVYDSLGREVNRLVDDNQNAGKYEVRFNGNRLSSGTYLVKLQAGDYQETKKIMLIK